MRLNLTALITVLISTSAEAAEISLLDGFDSWNWASAGTTIMDQSYTAITGEGSSTNTISPPNGAKMIGISPVDSSFSGYSDLSLSTQTNSTTLERILSNNTDDIYLIPSTVGYISRDFTLQADNSYSFSWLYVSYDYAPFADGVFYSVFDKDGDPGAGQFNLLARTDRKETIEAISQTGDDGYPEGTVIVESHGVTAWRKEEFSVSEDGVYSITFGSFNADDPVKNYSPILFISDQPGNITGEIVGGEVPNDETVGGEDENVPDDEIVGGEDENVPDEEIVGGQDENVPDDEIVGGQIYSLADAMTSLISTKLGLDSMLTSTSTLVNGAHSRPMSFRVAVGEKTFWLAGDWGKDNHGSRSGSIGLKEANGGYNFGFAQINLSLGKTWAKHGGIDSNGNYVMVEGIAPVEALKGLYATSGLYFQRGDVEINRAYLVSGSVAESSARPEFSTWGIRARLDWENAHTFKTAQVSPYVDAWHSRTKLNGYTETGGNYAARFDSRDDNFTEVKAGLNLAVPTNIPKFDIVANIESVHRFTGDSSSTTGEVIGVVSFNLDGEKYRQNWLKGGVGLEGKIGQGKASLMLNGTNQGRTASSWLTASYQIAF
jgi:hypothetical protein